MLNLFDKHLLRVPRGNSVDIMVPVPCITSADKVLFTVKKHPDDDDKIIQKTLTTENVGPDGHSLFLHLNPDDTMLVTGDYVYDFLFVTGNGQAKTIVSSYMIIEPSVGLITDVKPIQYELYVDHNGATYVDTNGLVYACRKESNNG